MRLTFRHLEHGRDASRATVCTLRSQGKASAPSRPTLIYLISVDWFFCSHFLHLARRARDSGWSVIIASHFARDRERLAREGFELIPIEARRAGLRPRGLFKTIRSMSHLLKLHPEAVLHGFGLLGILVGAIAGRFRRERRVVLTVTGRGYSVIGTGLSVRAAALALRVLCRALADGPGTRWLVENETDLSELGLRRAQTEKRAVIVGGAGVDPKSFALTPMPTRGPLRCAFVARAIWSKGIDLAVEAVARARAAGADVELTLAGAPDPMNPRSCSPAEIEALAAVPGVRWLGWVHDVAGLWREHHVALLPSRGGEGVPKSLIEAAMCGRPIITTDVPGCRELAGASGGWIAPAGDVDALAAALIEAAGAADLAARGMMAHETALRSYSEEAVWRATLESYLALTPEATGESLSCPSSGS